MASHLPPRFLFFFLLLLLRRRRSSATSISTEFIYPNFSVSSVNYLETNGVFLSSAASVFSCSLDYDSPQSPFIFSIVHSPTTNVVWSANAASPAPYTAQFSFTTAGLSIAFSNASVIWSTPRLPRPAASLRLLDSGNLLLLDASNSSLWESFQHPTDTLLSSQHLPAGASLSTLAGDYSLLVTDDDAILLWESSQQFWRLSSDLRSVKDLNAPVAFMAANESGLFLFSDSGRVVFEVDLPPAKLRIMKLQPNGQFSVFSYPSNGSSVLVQSLVAPNAACDLPSSCKTLAVCTPQNQDATCSCPDSFAASNSGSCVPSDGSPIFSPSECNTSGNQAEPSYQRLGSGISYFANKFANPDSAGGDFSSCRGICSGNCSCLGFFYSNSSRSCYLIKSQIGSFSNVGASDAGIGFVKIPSESPSDSSKTSSSSSSSSNNLLPILLPSIAVFLLVLVLVFAGTQWNRRRRRQSHGGKRRSRSATASSKTSGIKDIHLGRNHLRAFPADEFGFPDSDSDSDSDEISIPGLPTRFAFSDLAAATENFSIKIGSGGFGEVFRGQLPDQTLVAVKRISAGASFGGLHGKKEFCTEIAVIGNIHHVNLVRLRGFCAEGRRRMLVYEFMNRGSLDRSIFAGAGPGPVLEWRERMDIAIGAARGLAYLHFGCDQKIIHCDVKPENILLHDGGGVKISDFGLAKLISPDQSGFFTTMRGTRGYLAPEWLTNSAISDRTDVYSYGMVLLEIIHGRKNRREAETSGGGGGSSSAGSAGAAESGYFPMAALDMHERGSYLGLADRRLEGRVTEEEVRLAVKVALCCLHEEPALRPTMASVAAMLEGTVEVAQPRPDALNFLRLYGRGFVDYTGSATTTADLATGTTTSSSAVSYSYMTSQDVSGPR